MGHWNQQRLLRHPTTTQHRQIYGSGSWGWGVVEVSQVVMMDGWFNDGWWMMMRDACAGEGHQRRCGHVPTEVALQRLVPLWIFLPQQAPWSRQCLRIPTWGWSREHLGYSDTPKYPCKTKMVQKSSLGTLDVPFSSWCFVPMNTLKRRSICIEMYCRWKMVEGIVWHTIF